MEKIEAIILDLDGTLLDDQKNMDEVAQQIIRKIKNNIKIIIVSARQFYRIEPYLRCLDIMDDENYTICFNGSLVVNNKEKILFSSFLDEKVIMGIDDFILKNKNLEWTYYLYNDRFSRNQIDDMKEFSQKNNIFKIVGSASPKELEKLKLNLPREIYNMVEVTSSESERIEFVSKGMTKLQAIELLFDQLNIKKENVIAFGDGDNDSSMLKYVGCGIAMKNSPDEVKRSANMVTEYTNNENGVGLMIQNLLSKQENENNV